MGAFPTALQQLEKTFKEAYNDITKRTEHMKANCENGCFNNSANFDQGDYSWGVEKVSECEWYVFLNVNGIK